MINEEDAKRLENELESVLSEIKRNVSMEATYTDADQIRPTFSGLDLIYETLRENWSDIRELREGNYLPEVGGARKENIREAYDYLRGMADRIEHGEVIDHQEKVPLDSLIESL